MIFSVKYVGKKLLIQCDCGTRKLIEPNTFYKIKSCGCIFEKSLRASAFYKSLLKKNIRLEGEKIRFSLMNGKDCLISWVDRGKVVHSWNESKRNCVEARIKGKLVKLHRKIMSPEGDMVVDHINGNILDNTRSNLRICTQKQNTWNSKGYGKLGAIGVSKEQNKFLARITHNGICIRIGTFDDFDSAKKAYNEMAVKLRGEYAKTSP